MTVYPYTWRDQSLCFPPRDVLDALGAPRQVRQARIIVFAATQQAAFGALSRRGMNPRIPRDLGPASGIDVRAIIAQHDNEPNSVYATHGGNIVRVHADADGTGRYMTAYYFRNADGHAVVDSAEPVERPDPVVTDAMVDAAFAALPGWISREPIRDSMRAAITAALKAQEDGL